MVDELGMTAAEAARKIGVSRQAVSKRLIELRGKTTRVVAAKKVEQIVDRKIDAITQLQEINKRANELLDEAENDPALTLRVMAEIRGQLRLQLDIFQTLYSLQAVEEFQHTVIETIGKVAPDVRQQIIAELNRERSVRSAVRFS